MLKLKQEQLDTFRNDGVVIVDEVLTDDDLQPVIDAVSEFIDRRAKELQDEEKIEALYEDEPFERRYGRIYAQCNEIAGGLDIMQLRDRRVFEFLRNDNLMDVVEDILGTGEILCNPIQHIRAKIPANAAGPGPDYFHNVPWHQDAGVTWEEADPTDIVTFWLPLVDATEERGCMQVMTSAFRRGHLDHQKEGGTTIVPEQLPDIDPMAAVCPKRGIVIMNKYTPHRSTTNCSEVVRWSLDLRYQPIGEPTGRPFHPAFVTRSRTNPDTVFTDHQGWCDQWVEAMESASGVNAHRTVK